MNREQNRRQKRLVRHKASRRQKRRISEMKPNQGMTPRCKEILAKNRQRLLEESKVRNAISSNPITQRRDRSLRKTMASA